MTDWLMRTGELAAATGLTVRTLHHYDEIGLLVPSRSAAGHRRYRDADVRRLYRIVALRQLGFSLPEVAALMDGGGLDPRDVVRRQLAELERHMREQESLRQRLNVVLAAFEGAAEPSAQELIDIMEAMHRMERYYTPEQRAKLAERSQQLGEEGLERGQKAWAELISAMDLERQRGTDPADPRVQELRRRWQQLIDEMTGGDEGIRQSMQRMFETEGPQAASGGAMNADLWAYVKRAYAAG
jgi:DNA-binding transcriptional MerR regulator